MGEQVDDRILEDILAALEQGDEPDLERLRVHYPGDAERIGRLVAAARSYRRMSPHGGLQPAALELEPGARVADFEIEGLLARGGMGEVYRARQLSLGRRRVALKFLPKAPLGGKARSRFEREGLLLASLHHPRLAEVYAFGEERGRCFIAMRLVEGSTLKEIHEELARAGADRSDVALRRRLVSWVADIADALAAVHARGLVHRDVKPANVVVEGARHASGGTPEGVAVLVDFGLVRPVVGDSETLTGATPATPDYASPEQLLGGELLPASDVFSLGATLHDLLTGRLPGERGRAAAGLEPIERLVPTMDRDLAALTSKAADPVARWRYADGGELLADLRAWLEGRPVAARRRPLAERVRRGIVEQPGRLLRWVGAAVLATALALGLADLGRLWSRAESLRAAHAAGDMEGLWRAGAALPGWLRWPLLRDQEHVALARRAARQVPGDPLAEVAELLRQDRHSDALFLAVTHLRLAGLSDEPMLTRYLEASLRKLPEAGSTSTALILTARLFYERPAADQEALVAAAGISAELWRLWHDPRIVGDARLYVLSALAHCGRGETALKLARWVIEPTRNEEERRLGFAFLKRHIRGQYVAGLEAELDLPRLCAELRSSLRETFQQRDLTQHDWPVTQSQFQLRHVADELAAVERGSGQEPHLTGIVPDSWICELEARGRWAEDVAQTLSRFRDPRVLPCVEDWMSREVSGATFRTWGALTARMGDQELVERIRARCIELASGESDPALALADFDAGVATARQEEIRKLGPSDLDSDSLLGAGEPAARMEAFNVVRAEVATEADVGLVAGWDFGTDPPRILSAARGASARAGSSSRGERQEPFLRLYDFGASELRLAFEIESAPSEDQLELTLFHIGAERSGYPHGGEVCLDVAIDTAALAQRVLVSQSNPCLVHGQRLLVPVSRLQAGRHELSIRLHPDTTTTYRLYRVELAPFRGPIERRRQ